MQTSNTKWKCSNNVPTGQRGELLVAEKLISKGWDVADPLGHNHAYDLLAIKGDKILKIQVKATVEYKTRHKQGFYWQFNTSKGRHRNTKYEVAEVDFFILVALDVSKYWIVPYKNLTAICVKIGAGDNKYRKFEDAWEVLDK